MEPRVFHPDRSNPNYTVYAIGLRPRPAAKPRKAPKFACQECGRKFYSARAARLASFGDAGCPGCGGSDIDAV